jgi:hypothetical protein
MYQNSSSAGTPAVSAETYQTVDVTADSWQKQPDGNYRSTLKIPPGISDAHSTAIIQKVFINGAEVGSQPTDYAGGQIWFINYFNTGYDLFFRTTENVLPFSSIQLRMLILKKQN